MKYFLPLFFFNLAVNEEQENIFCLFTCSYGVCLAQPQIEFGPLTELRTDEGRLSFGTIVSADVVAWSAPDAQDLLIARLWDGVYLYPSKDLQTIGEPIRLCDQLGHVVLMVEPVDWDGDGKLDVLLNSANADD